MKIRSRQYSFIRIKLAENIISSEFNFSSYCYCNFDISLFYNRDKVFIIALNNCTKYSILTEQIAQFICIAT